MRQAHKTTPEEGSPDLSKAVLVETTDIASPMLKLIEIMRQLASEGVDIWKIKYRTLDPADGVNLLPAIEEEQKGMGRRHTQESCVLVMNAFLKHCEINNHKPSVTNYEKFSHGNRMFPSYVWMRALIGPGWSDVLRKAQAEITRWNAPSQVASPMVNLIDTMRQLRGQGVDIRKIKYRIFDPEAGLSLLPVIEEEQRGTGRRHTQESCVLVMNAFSKHCGINNHKPSVTNYAKFSHGNSMFPSVKLMRAFLGPGWSDVLRNAQEETTRWNTPDQIE